MGVAISSTGLALPEKSQDCKTDEFVWALPQHREGKLPVLLLIRGHSFKDEDGPPTLISLRETLLIGRDAYPTLCCADALPLSDRFLSRQHLTIRTVRGGLVVEDCGSRNGTWLNGRRLSPHAPARLADGSLLSFGGQAALLRYLSPSELSAVEDDLRAPFGPVPTVSPCLSLSLARLRCLAKRRSEFLFIGETGSGKEVYARALHRFAERTGRFVAINCAQLPSELADSELFGYERGAHSMATSRKPGLVDDAQGGTLFLDEIGELPPALQPKLLRFLQTREVRPLGATRSHELDVLLVAATNRLEGMRSDLVARFGSEPIKLPPLRDRIEDLGALVTHFQGREGGRPLDPQALLALCLYKWPHNVRELERVLAEADAFAASDGSPFVKAEHLPSRVLGALTSLSPARQIPSRRPGPARSDLDRLLGRHQGNVARVARELERKPSLVWRWIARHGLDPARHRPSEP